MRPGLAEDGVCMSVRYRLEAVAEKVAVGKFLEGFRPDTIESFCTVHRLSRHRSPNTLSRSSLVQEISRRTRWRQHYTYAPSPSLSSTAQLVGRTHSHASSTNTLQ